MAAPNPNEAPREYRPYRDSAEVVLEAALDAGEVPEPLRPHYRRRLGHALVWEALEVMETLQGDAETARYSPSGRCGFCECETCREEDEPQDYLTVPLCLVLAVAACAVLYGAVAAGPFLGWWIALKGVFASLLLAACVPVCWWLRPVGESEGRRQK